MEKVEEAPTVGNGSLPKQKDGRLSGIPGEIKVTYSKKGEKTETLIGDDGMAIKEIHYSTHGNGDIHNNPHGHIITYDPVTGFLIGAIPLMELDTIS